MWNYHRFVSSIKWLSCYLLDFSMTKDALSKIVLTDWVLEQRLWAIKLDAISMSKAKGYKVQVKLTKQKLGVLKLLSKPLAKYASHKGLVQSIKQNL